MRKLCVYIAAVLLLLIAGALDHRAKASTLSASASLSVAAEAVDLGEQIRYRCRRVLQCGPSGCYWRRSCLRLCPDGYSCYPLYGAYGPYGGRGYWGGYTFSGWDYRYK